MTAGYEPRFDIDRAYGEVAERSLRAQLDLVDISFEVKRKTFLDDRFYVEVAQKPRGKDEYVKSGIQTSEADYWVYEIADTGVKIIVPREALRKAAAASDDRREEKDGDNPTKGRLIRLSEILHAAHVDSDLLEELADESFTGPPARAAA